MEYTEYADVINANIQIIYYHNQGTRWCAHFQYCEIKHGGCLLSEHGNGNTPLEAISKYFDLIRGQNIVFNTTSDNRREFEVPQSITVTMDKQP